MLTPVDPALAINATAVAQDNEQVFRRVTRDLIIAPDGVQQLLAHAQSLLRQACGGAMTEDSPPGDAAGPGAVHPAPRAVIFWRKPREQRKLCNAQATKENVSYCQSGVLPLDWPAGNRRGGSKSVTRSCIPDLDGIIPRWASSGKQPACWPVILLLLVTVRFLQHDYIVAGL